MVHYNPKLDRSEQAGWKKYSDEAVPTEAEQTFWGHITVVVTVALAALALVVI